MHSISKSLRSLTAATACLNLFWCGFAAVAIAAPTANTKSDDGKVVTATTAAKASKVSTKESADINEVAPTMLFDEILDPGQRRPKAVMMSAEAALRSDRVERAIQLSRRAMQRDPDDLDIHKSLAEALERKLEMQTDKDPKLFGECVREWLIVMRNGAGMEKGTNFRGAGGILDHFFGDEEYYIEARKRVKHLTGYLPKPWETNDRFLKRVLTPSQAELSGKILPKEKP